SEATHQPSPSGEGCHAEARQCEGGLLLLPASARQAICASVVEIWSSSASNGDFAGESPAGCTNLRLAPGVERRRAGRRLAHAPCYGWQANFNAALAQLPEALRSERRGWGWNTLNQTSSRRASHDWFCVLAGSCGANRWLVAQATALLRTEW